MANAIGDFEHNRVCFGHRVLIYKEILTSRPANQPALERLTAPLYARTDCRATRTLTREPERYATIPMGEAQKPDRTGRLTPMKGVIASMTCR